MLTRLLTSIKNNLGFIVMLLLLFSVRSSLADWYHIPSGSMLPSVEIGDRVLVDKTAYRIEVPFTDTLLVKTGTPARGDIVVFESKAAGERLIKRVVGVAGDNVVMQNHRLRINGQPLSYDDENSLLIEKNSDGQTYTIAIDTAYGPLANFSAVTVPDGHVLVLGDNRSHSADSRVHGFVPIHEIKGKATRVVVSLDKQHHYLPRSDRFWQPLI
ncbi:signal peptidase I [Salinimonas iocasae]|uniref:Signal peptidase I n=2 Tax=Salinimonas iocasae TaxID=2572577 RepID=A0A5B7YIP0_9ALTE|nr:signal peptidase I [Salinimonas iocasae]QCZ95153.1 signal peptidase I [Salinimonas iocasae]